MAIPWSEGRGRGTRAPCRRCASACPGTQLAGGPLDPLASSSPGGAGPCEDWSGDSWPRRVDCARWPPWNRRSSVARRGSVASGQRRCWRRSSSPGAPMLPGTCAPGCAPPARCTATSRPASRCSGARSSTSCASTPATFCSPMPGWPRAPPTPHRRSRSLPRRAARQATAVVIASILRRPGLRRRLAHPRAAGRGALLASGPPDDPGRRTTTRAPGSSTCSPRRRERL